MPKSLAVLNVEDSKSDSDLIARHLKKAGYKLTFEQVETAAQMKAALKKRAWDIIIADYSLPQFDGKAALALLQKSGLDIPFIAVSGTIGEETAVGMMKAGAHDYLMKDNLVRLVPAVERELEQAQVRRERKQAATSLEDSEARFRAFFDLSPDAVILIDPFDPNVSWPIIDCNSAACLMNGYRREELVGHSIDILNMTTATKAERDAYLKRLWKEGSFKYETFHRHKNGAMFPVELSTTILKIGQRELVIGIDRDITDRKRAEEALRASEEKYRMIVETSAEGMWVVDKAWKTTYVNPAMTAMLGYAENELLGHHPLEFVDQREVPTASEMMKRREKGITEKTELRMRRKDGTIIWTYGTSVSLLDDKGEFVGGLSLVADITERKQAEETLRASEKRFRALIEHSLDSISLLNPDGTLLWESPSTIRTLGYVQDEFIGQNMFNLIHPEERESIRTRFAEIIQKPKSSERGFFRLKHSNGSWNWIELIATNLLDEPSISAIVVNYRDITKRKQAEHERAESETRYRSLFEDSPVSLWEEDFSEVKLRLDALRNEGVKDFRTYFASHPQAVLEYMSLIKIVDMNKATLKLFGAKDKADMFQNLTRFIDNDTSQSFENELISIAQGKTQFEWEGLNRTLDGRQIIVRLNLSVMAGFEDTYSKVIISMADITAHMQAEKTIRESEKLLRESQMIAGLGSYVVDFQSRTWTGSHILEQIFGIDESYNYSVEGWYALAHPDWRQEMSDYFAKEVLGKHMRFDKEYKTVRANDGAERWVHALGELEIDAHNQPVKMRGMIQDITERKQAEIEIKERTDDMELINSLNEAVNRGESLDHIFKLFSQELSQISRCNEATFYLLSPDGNNLVMQNLDRTRNSIKMIEQLIGRQIPLIQIPVKEGTYFQRALRSEKGILTTDPKIIQSWIMEFTEANFLSKAFRGTVRKLVPQISKLLGIRSAITIPLISDKKVFGLFDISSAEILTEKEFGRIRIISNQLTAVILRKQAEEEIKSLAKFPDENPTPVLRLNDKGIILYANKASRAVLEEWRATVGEAAPAFWREKITEVLESQSQQIIDISLGAKVLSFVITPVIEEGYVNFYARDITESKQAEEAVRKSEQRYHALFEDMPVSIWEEDFSEVKNHLDSLKQQGITDFRAYFESNPDAMNECAAMIRVLDINQAALKMYHAESKEAILEGHSQGLSDGELEHLIDDLVAIAQGKTSNNWEGPDETLTGVPIEISLSWSVTPGYEDDFSKVIVTTIDVTQRKQSQAALQKSEERFRALVANTGDLIVVINSEGIIQYASPSSERILGYSPEESMGKNFTEWVHRDDLSEVLKSLASRSKEPGIALNSIEARGRHKNGSWRILDTFGTSLLNEPAIEGIVLNIRDITERKRVEEDLRGSEQRYHALFEDMPIAIWEDDLSDVKKYLDSLKEEGVTNFRSYFQSNPEALIECAAMIKVLDVNQATLRLYRADSKESLYNSMNDGLSERVKEQLYDAFTAIAEGRTNHTWEGMDETVNGEPIEISLSWSTAPGHEHDFSKVIITNIDITERKKAEAENEYQLSELEALYENGLAISRLLEPRQIAQRMVKVIDQKLDWHHAAVRLYDASTDHLELIALNSPGFNETQIAEQIERINQAVNTSATGLSGWVIHREVIRIGKLKDDPRYIESYTGMNSGLYVPIKSGDEVMGSITIESEKENAFTQRDEQTLITLANQAAISFVNARLYHSAQQEISERTRMEKLLEQERNQLANRVEERTADLSRVNSDLARAMRVKDEFLASMSHELRTPLTGILGLSEALQLEAYGELNDKQSQTIKNIESSGRHLLELINDILDLSRIEAGKLELQFMPCSLADICQASLQLIKGMAQQKHQLVHYTPPTKPIIVLADARHLKQLLVNLLSNAIKFTPQNGELGLEIQASESENELRLIVWDKGIGIKPEDLPKLFKPFSQIDSSLAREYAGTGLGLSLAYRLAELHYGGIKVESVFGEGSRFTVSLPWSPQNVLPLPDVSKPITGGRPSLAPQLEASKFPLILLADDNEMVLQIFGDFLETKQCRVIKTRSGAELLEQAVEFHPDVILVDIQMPGMDGLETIRRIRSHKDPLVAKAPVVAVTALAMPGDRERCLQAGANEYMSKPVKLQELAVVIQKHLWEKE